MLNSSDDSIVTSMDGVTRTGDRGRANRGGGGRHLPGKGDEFNSSLDSISSMDEDVQVAPKNLMDAFFNV